MYTCSWEYSLFILLGVNFCSVKKFQKSSQLINMQVLINWPKIHVVSATVIFSSKHLQPYSIPSYSIPSYLSLVFLFLLHH